MSQRIIFAMVLMLVQLLLMSMFSIAKEPKEGVDYIWVDLGKENDEHGLSQTDEAGQDSATEVDTIGGIECRKNPVGGISYYIYFQIDDTFLVGGNNEVWIVMEYFDSVANPGDLIDCQYDSNGEGDVNGAYRGAQFGAFPGLARGGTNEWLFYTWHIIDGRFENRQNGGSDFRLRSSESTLAINRVWFFNVEPPSSWPDWAVEPSMKLATTWGVLKALKK